MGDGLAAGITVILCKWSSFLCQVHELIALEILTLLLENPTDDSVEVAIGFLKECGLKLSEVAPKGMHGMCAVCVCVCVCVCVVCVGACVRACMHTCVSQFSQVSGQQLGHFNVAVASLSKKKKIFAHIATVNPAV